MEELVGTDLSTRPFCLRMWYTSVDVAGPWSFWPFSISLSSSSMLWQEEDQHIGK